MEVLKYIVFGIDVIVCLALIILVLMQSKDDSGASATVMGASANNFYEKNKGRTKEGKMKKATVGLMIAFAILTIALSILYIV
ncbi:MAG: preprotein translocase subunit SecG [Candidatus Scatovivens sp.]